MLLKVGLPQTKRYLQGKGKHQRNERATCGLGGKNCSNTFDKELSKKKMYNMKHRKWTTGEYKLIFIWGKMRTIA